MLCDRQFNICSDTAFYANMFLSLFLFSYPRDWWQSGIFNRSRWLFVELAEYLMRYRNDQITCFLRNIYFKDCPRSSMWEYVKDWSISKNLKLKDSVNFLRLKFFCCPLFLLIGRKEVPHQNNQVSLYQYFVLARIYTFQKMKKIWLYLMDEVMQRITHVPMISFSSILIGKANKE